jgi:hypothetical protein
MGKACAVVLNAWLTPRTALSLRCGELGLEHFEKKCGSPRNKMT